MSASPDQFLVTPTEDQTTSSAVFEVPSSELKNSYKFSPKKSTGKIFYSITINLHSWLFLTTIIKYYKTILLFFKIINNLNIYLKYINKFTKVFLTLFFM